MYNLKKLQEAISRPNNSHTNGYYFNTKDYIMTIFYVMKQSGVKAGSIGTRGQHSGSSEKEYDIANGKNISDATLTSVNGLMLFDAKDYLQGTKGKKLSFPWLPTIPKRLTSEKGRIEYITNNPTYSRYLDKKDFIDFIENYYSAFDPSSEPNAFSPIGNLEENKLRSFYRFISLLKTKEPSSEVDDWMRIITSKYIKGEDREIIVQAIDYYESKNQPGMEKYREYSSLGDVAPEGDVDKLHDIIGADPSLSFSSRSILDIVPDSYKKNVEKELNHQTSIPIKDQLSLMYLGSFAIDRTNDVKTINAPKNEQTRMFIFTYIEPDEKGNYTKFPGIIKLVVCITKNVNIDFVLKGIYEIALDNVDIAELGQYNLIENGNLVSKMFGHGDDSFFAVQLPIGMAKNLSQRGIFGMTGEKEIKLPNRKPKEELKPTLESILFPFNLNI